MLNVAVDEAVGCAELADEVAEVVLFLVSEVIEDPLALGIGLDPGSDSLFDLINANLTFERLLLSTEAGLDLIRDSIHIDNLVVHLVAKIICNGRLAGHGVTDEDAVIDLVAHLLLEGLLAPLAHGLELVVLLEQRVDVVCADGVVLDLDLRRGSVGVRVDHGGNLGAVSLEALGLLDFSREVNKEELV